MDQPSHRCDHRILDLTQSHLCIKFAELLLKCGAGLLV